MSIVLSVVLFAGMLQQDGSDRVLNILLVTVIVSGLPGNVGCFIFNKDGSYADGIVSRAISTRQRVQAKLLFLMSFCMATYALLLPISVVVDSFLRWLLAANILYALCVGTIIVVFLGSYDTEKVDLQRSGILNYEGISFLKQTVILPLPMLPLLLFQELRVFGVVLIFVAAILSFAFMRKWLDLIIGNLSRRKHPMLSGCRK